MKEKVVARIEVTMTEPAGAPEGAYTAAVSLKGEANNLLNLVIRALEGICEDLPEVVRLEAAKPFCERVAECFLEGHVKEDRPQ